MSAQLTLDSLSGIDWEHPTIYQLEQFAIDNVPGCKTILERHNSFMCVRISHWLGAVAYLRPSLERTEDDRLEWFARLEYELKSGVRNLAIQGDEDLEHALWNMYVHWNDFDHA